MRYQLATAPVGPQGTISRAFSDFAAPMGTRRGKRKEPARITGRLLGVRLSLKVGIDARSILGIRRSYLSYFVLGTQFGDFYILLFYACATVQSGHLFYLDEFCAL
jgi:hypothetical protein